MPEYEEVSKGFILRSVGDLHSPLLSSSAFLHPEVESNSSSKSIVKSTEPMIPTICNSLA